MRVRRHVCPSGLELFRRPRYVDVEGHELAVLESIPFDSYDFRCLIVETHLLADDGSMQWRHRDLDRIEALLASHGFAVAATTTANTIYLRTAK